MKYYIDAFHNDRSDLDSHHENDVFLIEIQDQSEDNLKNVLSQRFFNYALIDCIDEAIKNEKAEKENVEENAYTKLVIKKCTDDEFEVLKKFMDVPELKI
jgi:hypothetical protein